MRKEHFITQFEAQGNRKRARERGLPQYLGQLCKAHHAHANSLQHRNVQGTVRYASTGACKECSIQRSRDDRVNPDVLARDRKRKRMQRERDASILDL